jgi:hypothetical protein
MTGGGMAKTHAKRLMTLFEGMKSAHGTYEIQPSSQNGSKKTGKAVTLKQEVTLKLWEDHVDGIQGLGIVPINEKNMCKWGVIDIDDYSLELRDLAAQIAGFNLPLILCRSKSGGAHLFLFTKEFVTAGDMQGKLKEIASAIGFGQCEIFPKQREILPEKGDIGNWLNMPYFNFKNTERYAFSMEGNKINISIFLKDAEDTSLTAKEFEDLSVEAVNSKGEFKDAPPCLQSLTKQGFPEGSRNNGLMALAAFAKKAFPDQWKKKIEIWNQKYFDPPLDNAEAQDVIKQAAKKDYHYRCNDFPIQSFCNSGVCRTRKHGVGSAGSLPSFTGLAKLDTDQPQWFLQTEVGRLELSTEELQQQQKFQRACMDKLNLMPPKMREHQWQAMIQGLMDNVLVIEAPKGASIEDQFFELVDEFCEDARLMTLGQEELLMGKAWFDHDEGLIYFRLRDLQDFLARNNFKYYTKTQIIGKINNLNSRDKCERFFNIKGKGCNTRYIIEEKLRTQFGVQEEALGLPDMGEGAI